MSVVSVDAQRWLSGFALIGVSLAACSERLDIASRTPVAVLLPVVFPWLVSRWADHRAARGFRTPAGL